MQLIRPIALAALVCVFAGCATTTETDAAKLSAGDVIFGQARLKEHLAVQRQILASLKTRADSLETDLLVQLGRLQKVQAEQATATGNHAAARAELDGIAAQRKQAQLKLDEVARAKAEIARQQTVAQQESAEALERTKQQQKNLRAEVERLEGEVALINDSIRRTLRLREEQMLREKND